MYAAGYKQVMVWAARNPDDKAAKINRGVFIKRLDKMTGKWNAARLSKLYTLILNLIETRRR
jgi:hypothetical protein